MAVQAEAFNPSPIEPTPVDDHPTPLFTDFSALSHLQRSLLAQASRKPDGRVPARYVPPKRGLPGRREGGGTRGNCQSPILLAPNDHIGVTTSEHPSFFWYVANPTPVEFMLMEEGLDGTDEAVFQTKIQASEAGIMQLQLPANSPPLKLNRSYTWIVTIYCDPQSLVQEPFFMQAMIQRVLPDINLVAQLRTASPENYPATYAAAGIWYDTLTTLANLRHSRPADTQLKAEWADLLRAIKLPNPVVNAPLVNIPGLVPLTVAPSSRSPATPANVSTQNAPGKFHPPDAKLPPRRDAGGGAR